MESEATRELRAIKDAIASEFKTFRAFFDALIAAQKAAHPELAAAR